MKTLPEVTPLMGGTKFELKQSASRVFAYDQQVVLSPAKTLHLAHKDTKEGTPGRWASSPLTSQIHLVLTIQAFPQRGEGKLLP